MEAMSCDTGSDNKGVWPQSTHQYNSQHPSTPDKGKILGFNALHHKNKL